MSDQNVSQEVENALGSRKRIEAYLATRAWEDDTYKDELFADPKAALSRDVDGFGNIPDHIEVSILQEDANHMYFVIPQAPVPTSVELSEEELEVVAGGSVCCVTATSNCCKSTML